jgi:hypothetical protein
MSVFQNVLEYCRSETTKRWEGCTDLMYHLRELECGIALAESIVELEDYIEVLVALEETYVCNSDGQ